MGRKGQKKQKGVIARENVIASGEQAQHNATEQQYKPAADCTNQSLAAPTGTMQYSRAFQHAAEAARFEQASKPAKSINMRTPPLSPLSDASTQPGRSHPASVERQSKATSDCPLSQKEQALPASTSTRDKAKTGTEEMVDYQFGHSPLVIACISCNNVCLITNREWNSNTRLGLRLDNNDRFLPVVCDECQEDNAHAWMRIANTREAPHRVQQYPSSISTRLLASWDVYEYFKDRFGVDFDQSEEPSKRVTRARDWWRVGALTDNTAIERITYFKLRRWTVKKEGGSASMFEEKWEVDEDYKKVMFFGEIATGKPV